MGLYCRLQCTVVGVVYKDLMLSCCVAVERQFVFEGDAVWQFLMGM